MSDRTQASQPEEGDSARRQIALRVSQLFGEDRAAANQQSIEAAAAAVERVRRMRPPDFAGLDPEERG